MSLDERKHPMIYKWIWGQCSLY